MHALLLVTAAALEVRGRGDVPTRVSYLTYAAGSTLAGTCSSYNNAVNELNAGHDND